MITRSDSYQAPSLFSGLSDMLDHGHPLFQLAERIDWKRFDDAFEPLFCQDNGRPAKSVRLMTGLLILKHVRDISDESVVDQWRDAGTRKEEHLIKTWIHTASNGGVLISPFIADKEKEFKEKAEARNAKIILLSNEAFGERYKPAAHDFHQCESGNLLIIAPSTRMPECRKTFLFLNKLAEDIADCKI